MELTLRQEEISEAIRSLEMYIVGSEWWNEIDRKRRAKMQLSAANRD